MNSQIKFVLKGVGVLFFWLFAIAFTATLFGCEPEVVCGKLTEIHWTRNTVYLDEDGDGRSDYKINVDTDKIKDYRFGQTICLEIN